MSTNRPVLSLADLGPLTLKMILVNSHHTSVDNKLRPPGDSSLYWQHIRDAVESDRSPTKQQEDTQQQLQLLVETIVTGLLHDGFRFFECVSGPKQQHQQRVPLKRDGYRFLEWRMDDANDRETMRHKIQRDLRKLLRAKRQKAIKKARKEGASNIVSVGASGQLGGSASLGVQNTGETEPSSKRKAGSIETGSSKKSKTTQSDDTTGSSEAAVTNSLEPNIHSHGEVIPMAKAASAARHDKPDDDGNQKSLFRRVWTSPKPPIRAVVSPMVDRNGSDSAVQSSPVPIKTLAAAVSSDLSVSAGANDLSLRDMGPSSMTGSETMPRGMLSSDVPVALALEPAPLHKRLGRGLCGGMSRLFPQQTIARVVLTLCLVCGIVGAHYYNKHRQAMEELARAQARLALIDDSTKTFGELVSALATTMWGYRTSIFSGGE